MLMSIPPPVGAPAQRRLVTRRCVGRSPVRSSTRMNSSGCQPDPKARARDAVALMLGVCLATSAAAQPDDPATLIEEIRSARLEPSWARDATGVRLGTEVATLDLEHGVLIPVRSGGGRVVELVFVGRGRARLEPPDQIEAGQLELFTGSPRLAETFTEAVFVVARDEAASALLRRPPAAHAGDEILRRASARYAAWKTSPERRTLGVETGILLDALRDPLYEDYFAGWFMGEQLGEFLLRVDPAAEEQINLGQFVRVDVAPEEKHTMSRFLHRQQKRGRLVGLEVEDLGRWDSWVQSPLRAPDGQPQPGSPGFEPTHYTLDVTVNPRSGHLASRSKVHLRAIGGQRRVVRLELHPDLEITRLTDGDGRELFYLRAGNDLQVVLPHAPPKGGQRMLTPPKEGQRNTTRPEGGERDTLLADGDDVVLQIDCEGSFFEADAETGPEGRRATSWALRDALGWYPRTGANERATYDVTLRWPRRYELLASGRKLDGGVDHGQRWERRRMRVPTLGFTFEVGHFEVESINVDDVRLNVALDSGTLEQMPEGAVGELMFTVADALRYYQQVFGRYPLDELTVVTVPRQYSQAMLGLVTLSNRVMVDWGVFGPLLRVQDRGSVVAHEVAHQWWGHLVGWRSYRDQWISEAMANYATLLWARHRGLKPAVGPVTGWQQELTATLDDGRPIESLGPLVLGERLFSSRSRDAYQAIVYRKGALVLEMLARKFGEQDFLRALEALVGAAAGRVISTADFLSLLEQITAIDLDAFARQFIFGTGLPEVTYDYAFEPDGEGGWRVHVDARQEMPARTRYAVVPTADGGLDVARGQVDPPDVEDSELVVPFQILLAGDAGNVSESRQRILIGRMVISGRHTELTLELDEQPIKLWLDRDREIFGRFLDRRLHPKRLLLQQASKLASAGDLEAAADTLRRALATRSPLASNDDLLDAHLHLRLAGVLLDLGSDADAAGSLDGAREAFEQGKAELPRSEVRRFASAFEVVEARIEVRRGDYLAALERLRGGVLDPKDATSTEGYLLLAIAARATGNHRELEQALEIARRRGADVSPLTAG